MLSLGNKHFEKRIKKIKPRKIRTHKRIFSMQFYIFISSVFIILSSIITSFIMSIIEFGLFGYYTYLMGSSIIVSLAIALTIFTLALIDVTKYKKIIKISLIVSIASFLTLTIISLLTNGFIGRRWVSNNCGGAYVPFGFKSYYCWWIFFLSLFAYVVSAFAYLYFKKDNQMYNTVKIEYTNDNNEIESNLEKKLERIVKLKEKGIIFDNEYKILRSSIIEKYSN